MNVCALEVKCRLMHKQVLFFFFFSRHVHQHLSDLEDSVRVKKQCVDRPGLKLSTKANNV